MGMPSSATYLQLVAFHLSAIAASGPILFLLTISLSSDLLQASFGHSNLLDLLPINPGIHLIRVETKHASDGRTFLCRLRIPPDHIFVLLSLDDSVVVRCLSFVGATSLRLRWCEEIPFDSGLRQIPSVTRQHEFTTMV